MRSSIVFGVLYSAAAASAAACNADNCYRAILGTIRGQSASRVSDCASFLAYTSTLAPVTNTVVQTFTPSAAVVNATYTPADTSVSVTSTPPPTTLLQTITPAPVVVTVTVTPMPTTVTITKAPVFAKHKRGLCKRVTSSSGAAPANVTSASVSAAKTIPAYASACSGTSRYVSACSCGGVTSSTITVPGSTVTVTATTTLGQQTRTSAFTLAQQTSTVTVTLSQETSTVMVTAEPATTTAATTLAQQTVTNTVPLPEPSACGNAGLQWAYYHDNQPTNDVGEDLNFNPTGIKRTTPVASGVTKYVGVIYQGSNNGIYGYNTLPVENYIVSHRAYLYAPETGTYVFTLQRPDDVITMWVGSPAYSGWNNGNYNLLHAYHINEPARVWPVRLEAGRYYPMRFVFKNGGSYALLSMTLVSPSGRLLISSNSNSAGSPYVVQYSCDQRSAPPFQPFGQET